MFRIFRKLSVTNIQIIQALVSIFANRHANFNEMFFSFVFPSQRHATKKFKRQMSTQIVETSWYHSKNKSS